MAAMGLSSGSDGLQVAGFCCLHLCYQPCAAGIFQGLAGAVNLAFSLLQPAAQSSGRSISGGAINGGSGCRCLSSG
jgi:hypothetical protein